MKIKCFLSITVIFCALGFSHALEVKTDSVSNKSVFGISFPAGTSLYMSSSAVASISMHDYISGTLTITEIVIDTLGGTSQIRIYNVRPIDPVEEAKNAAVRAAGPFSKTAGVEEKIDSTRSAAKEKTGLELVTTDKVYKQYPTTTHTKTVEYAVDNLAELSALYKALIKDFAGASADGSNEGNLASQNSLGGKLYKIERGQIIKIR